MGLGKMPITMYVCSPLRGPCKMPISCMSVPGMTKTFLMPCLCTRKQGYTNILPVICFTIPVLEIYDVFNEY